MNKKLLLLPLVSCALLTSCTEEGTNDTNNKTGLPKQAQGKTVTFTAAPVSIETKSASTKVNVKPDGDNDILEWTSEDISFFFFGGNDNYFYEDFAVTVTDGFTGKQISMTGQVPDEEGSYGIYAISPAGDYFKGNVSPTSTVTIAQEQTQTLSNGSYTHLSDYIFLYSNPDEILEVDAAGNSDGEFEMNFSPLSSLLRFDISTTSAEPVTLNSITIKYVNGSGSGKLYRSATLNEFYGTLEGNASDTYSDMTLDLPANAIISGSTTYNAYMAAFPSGGAGTLEITLDVTIGTNSSSAVYECSDVEFIGGGRSHIAVNLVAGYDFPDANGVTMLPNGNNLYPTAQYPTGQDDATQIWMLYNSNEGTPSSADRGRGSYYSASVVHTACDYANGWRVPLYTEQVALAKYLNSITDATSAYWFRPTSQSAGWYSSASYSGFTEGYDFWGSTTTFGYTAYGLSTGGGTQTIYAPIWANAQMQHVTIRCVKD
jgi:hypothetical protein